MPAAATRTEPSSSLTDSHCAPIPFADIVWKRWLAFCVVSMAVLAPCFWQRHIEAGDLRSHLYNAWLAQLIAQGRAPGLWIGHQWTNVLFDCVLTALGRIVGLHMAERIAVSAAVLIFFWGAFSFIRVFTGRSPWFLAPLIAVIAYGWTFWEGIFNYYISIGLAFLGLAVAWRWKSWPRALTLTVLLILMILAHPFGVAWFAGAGLYVAVAERVQLRLQVPLVASAIAALAVVHVYLKTHFRVQAPAHTIAFYNGLDQMIFTGRYEIVAGMAALLIGAMLCVYFLGRRSEPNFWGGVAVLVGLYTIMEAAIQLLPDTIYTSLPAPAGDIAARLTSISAVLLCAIAGTVRARKWHAVATAGIALVFFTFVYQDTARISGMEEKAQRLVGTLPPGQRVLETVIAPLKYRFSVYHMVERVCIEHCFSWGNYEPASHQFRVRASPGNAIVVTDITRASLMEQGIYLVQPEDLPAYQAYQCGASWMELCMRPLQAGEMNNPASLVTGAAQH